METERRKAVLWVKDFQMEVSLAPVTPAKPAPPAPRPIATDGQETRPSQAHMAESESYLSRCSHQGHQAQRLVSCPVSSVEASNSRSCDGHIGRFASHGDLGLPQSSSEARRTAPFPASDSANFGETTGGFNHQWKEEMSIDRLNCNAGVQRESSDDPLSQYYQFRFRDLLGMNKAALMPSISEMLPGIGGDSNNGFAFDLNSPNEGNRRSLNSGSSAVGDDRHLMQFSQPIGGNYTQQMQQSDVPHDFWSLYNSGTPVSMQASITNGSRSVLAPGTPDHCRRLDDSFPAERTGSQTGQNAKDQDTQQDNQVAATRVDLQELQNNEETAGSEVLPGMVSALMENHNPDKGSNNAIDLNKTPQQKARRKKHRPKVISENKPKRGPKPQNPKPTDPKDTPRAKRKYVRKNKTNPPLTTPPAKATEETDQNVPNHSVKSCRRSLNFNLDPQMKEDSSLNKSNRDPSSETQADNHSASGIQLKEKAHQGKGQEVTVDMRQAGTAYDLCHAINQMLKGYMTLPQEEMPITPDLTNTTTSEEKGKAMADSVSTTKGNGHAADSMKGCSRETIFRADCLWAYSVSSSTCGSSNDGEQTTGLKRAFPFTADTADMSSRNLTSTHGAFCSSNDQFLGNGDINRMAKILFPEIYKKKRTEVLNRSNTVCASSSIISEDATEITIDQNCPRETSTGSRYLYCNPPSHLNTSAALNDLAEAAGGSAGNRMSFMHTWTDIEKLKRKRSKGPIRACDVASPTRFAGCKELPTLPGKPAAKLGRRKKVNVSNGPHACTEPPAADPPGDRAAKKRSKKRNSASSSPPMNMQLGLVVYRKHQSAGNSSGTLLALPWEDLMSIDSITTGLQQLDINRESCNLTLIEQKALVPYHASQHVKANFIRGESTLILYGKDGSIVPFRGSSEAVKKRRERAKVDLDDETDRVWKLLLDNINNEGIDGTDEEKAKWWDEERKVFHGRVDSFIARMRLVQGDRRFTPWKGSVVDSVIGVFLTQNVADHLSSSAFMSLAAHFPLKCQDKTQYDETTLLVKELEDSELDHDDVDTCSGKMLDEPVCDRSSRTLQDIDHGEEKEIVNSRELLRSHPYAVSQKDNTSRCINSMESSDKMPNESRVRAAVHIIDIETASTSGDTRIKDDIISSQQSVLSSQTSVTSPSAPAGATIGSGSESNSEAEDLTTSSSPYLDHPTSFMELLKMAEAPRQHEAYIHKSGHRTSCQQNSNNRPEMEQDEEVKGAFGAEFPKSSFKAPNFSKNYQLHLRTDVQVVDEESRSSNDSTRKDDSCTTEQSELTTESTTQSPSNDKISETILKPISSPKNLRSCYIFEGEKMVIHSQGLVRDPPDIANSLVQRQETSMEKDPNFPTGMTVGVMGRTSPFYDKAENHGHNDIDRNSAHDRASGEPCNMVKTNTAKQNKATVGKGTKTESDWDSLRKQAQATGRKREKMANTMDSLDYEAVRCADVSEIADTIRERGMNNRLAERIKDFLNRLVSEHGGIDLEWLREVPPDKAKEYLLSIRGLGLKSVECVRLLTLHHLAFPVDTNVGRIAVRLGWVPLQPLPESLQLHLLELYPVLESIQKYLWPRLCKLDQRTLYELHYHMITFGKVFCTKRQPNCNACPLRGECRHFASAFASARLALPGPEGRSIMASINCGVHHEDPQVNITPFALEAPQANTLSETKPEVTECEPIVEVPASPEPAEQIQTLECDIEDTFCEDPNEIPTIKLNMEQFTQTLQTYMQANKELQPTDMSKALVALTAEAASIPTPKLKNVSRLRTEHHVYELPDTHPLLDGLDKREPGDPCSYLLAIWTPGETANSSQPPERKCNCQEPGELCEDETCFYCNSQREANSQIVRGTLLIPCRTAMRGSFPLNGTYFQVNEVFADHDSSLNPIAVPRDWLWNLPRRTVYFGTSIPTIMRGLSTEGIQHCFWRGYVCVRGFDQKSRAPRPLMARLHLPASKMTKSKGKANAFSSQQDD